jgi:phosphoglycolate phosphatase-like HAD superfamily hydrolase
MDFELLLGSLELDAQVALNRHQQDRLKSGQIQLAAPDSFKAGYEHAVSVMLLATRRLLTEQLKGLGQEPPTDAVLRLASRAQRLEPENWKIIDTNSVEILSRIVTLAKSCNNPAVVFDLDGTLVDVSYRTLGILKEWLASKDLQTESVSPLVLQRLAQINLTHIGYSLGNAFENAGLDLREETVAKAFEASEAYWRKRFFDGHALVDFDREIIGAKDFVAALVSQGVEVIYLTGRSDAMMREGTETQLKKLGFPAVSQSIVMKTDLEMEDHVFKQSAFSKISASRDVVGNFENEYINIKSMMETAPSGCLHVIVDSQHSGRPVPAHSEPVRRIIHFG